MSVPTVALEDEVTVVLASRFYRGRIAEVIHDRPRFSVFLVVLVSDDYNGTYWFGVHEESRAWFRGWGDDVEAAFLLQRSAVG